MDRIAKYDIAFTGLKNGKHNFTFDINQEFFDSFEAENEFTDANVYASVLLDKHSSFMKFEIKIKGSVLLICDISGREFRQSINGYTDVVVKFGEQIDDTDDEMLTISHNQSEFNVAKLIFDAVLLSIPMKRLSPDLTDEDFEILNNFSPKVGENYLDDFHENSDENTDPRWSVLKKIRTR